MPVLGGYAIFVDFNGAVGAFSRITGIRSDSAVLESNVSNEKGPYVQKVPGRYSCYQVTFQAGFMLPLQADGPWWQNVEHIQAGDVNSVRGACVITFLDNEKNLVLTVTLDDAWPSRWSASDVSIQRSVLWMETIVFQCESISYSWNT